MCLSPPDPIEAAFLLLFAAAHIPLLLNIRGLNTAAVHGGCTRRPCLHAEWLPISLAYILLKLNLNPTGEFGFLSSDSGVRIPTNQVIRGGALLACLFCVLSSIRNHTSVHKCLNFISIV